MMDKKLDKLIEKHAAEIDKNNFRNFILDIVKECGAEGIRTAKKTFEEEGLLEAWDKEVFKIVQQLLGVQEV